MKELRADVVVVGAGVCGLLTALKLARLGIDVVLVEQASRVATEASSRNEGWLHCGTYHSVSIADREEALYVAQSCVYGHEQLMALAPEAVEPSLGQTIALIRDPTRCAEAVDRWREVGIPFREIGVEQAKRRLPSVNVSRACGAFYVKDVGVNFRIIYRRAFMEFLNAKGRVLLRHTFRFSGDGTPEVVTAEGIRLEVCARSGIVVAAGIGIQRILEELKIESPLRLWKSHILYGRPMTSQPMFWLDPLEVTVINHLQQRGRTVAVIGMNEDAVRVSRLEASVDLTRVEILRASLERSVPGIDVNAYSAFACIKIDLCQERFPRSLRANILRVTDNLIVVQPGKMTQAPFIADRVVQQIYNDLDDETVAYPPWNSSAPGG